MRIYLKLTKNRTIVPFNHIPALVGTLHKWLGENEWHNEVSMYSFSWLKGGVRGSDGLYFPNGAEWFVSSHDNRLLKQLITGIQKDPSVNFGLQVKQILIREDPVFGQAQSFTVASPVLIKRRQGESTKHFLYSDKESDDFLTETLKTKLKRAGLNSDNVKISFNREYHKPQTKLVNYNGVANKASVCPVIVEGNAEQIAFAWNVGIGNSTGIGFGALN